MSVGMQRRRLAARLLLVLLAMLAMGVVPAVAAAQGVTDVILSTRYPGVTTRPGESLTFPLEARSEGAPAMATLRVTTAPEGWETVLRGGGFVVHKVFTHPENTAYLDLQVQVPKDAKPGDYRFVLSSESPVGTRTLPLDVRVQPQDAAKADLLAQYPALEGPSGAQFEFRVTLKNTGGTKQLFSLASKAPQGWEVTFNPAYQDKRIATIAVDAGASESLDVKVKTPEQTAAGDYRIPILASGDAAQATTELLVALTGTNKLQLEPVTQRYNATATAGDDSVVELLVRNTGTAELSNITFNNYAPTNWKVSFKPETVDRLAAGESRQVRAILQPPGKAIAGDYVVSITANTTGTSDTADFRVAVETPTVWGWVGVGLIVLVVAGVGLTFRHYGRR